MVNNRTARGRSLRRRLFRSQSPKEMLRGFTSLMNTPKPSELEGSPLRWPIVARIAAVSPHATPRAPRRRSREVGQDQHAAEIKHEWPGHDSHLDDPQLIVVMQHFRDGATANIHDRPLGQPQIHIALAAVVALALMDFDGRSAFFALPFDGKYGTLNSCAQGVAKNQTVPLAVFLRTANKLSSIAHERTANRRSRPLCRRADSLACEWVRLAGSAARPPFPGAEKSRRSSPLRRRDRPVDRRPREPLGGASPQWRPSRTPENSHFTPCRRPRGAPTSNRPRPEGRGERAVSPANLRQCSSFNAATARRLWSSGYRHKRIPACSRSQSLH